MASFQAVQCVPNKNTRWFEWMSTMKLKRLLLICVALGAGLMAALIVGNMSKRPAPKQQVIIKEEVAQPAIEVLVAKADIGVGQTLQPNQLGWQAWPEGGSSDRFITRKTSPDALEAMAERIARQSIFKGEPIQEVKLVAADRGFMSAILPLGMRAVAVEVRAANTAGGFILPNDRVDLLLTRTNANDTFVTETLLENIRVLAIDQQIQDPKEGGAVVARDTATLELTPSQAEMVTQSQQIGSISLSLRSIKDSNPDAVSSTVGRRSGGVNIVRFGVPTKEVTRQ